MDVNTTGSMDFNIGDLVEDGPGGPRWIITDVRGGELILRPPAGGGGATYPATPAMRLTLLLTAEQRRAEFPERP